MLVEALILSIGLNLVGFLLGYSFRSDKFTDISYALTFSIITMYAFIRSDMSIAHWIVAVLIWVWALRIGSYLLKRIQYMGRDKRFDTMRDSFVRFGGFWLLQAATVWLVLFPALLLFAVEIETTLTVATYIGVAVSVIGLLFETVADRQKFRFITNEQNKNKWIDTGLWRYSRHPNYFGEIMMWIGVYIISVQWLNQPESYLAIIGPATIIFMILFVSGVPLLEKSAEKKWGKIGAYKAYRERTSILIPLPPKKEK